MNETSVLPKKGELWEHKVTGIQCVIVGEAEMRPNGYLVIHARQVDNDYTRLIRVNILLKHFRCRERHYQELMERIIELMEL